MKQITATVTRMKLYPTPGKNPRVAWKWAYTVTIPGEPYSFSGETLSWVRSLIARKRIEAGPDTHIEVNYAWMEEGK